VAFLHTGWLTTEYDQLAWHPNEVPGIYVFGRTKWKLQQKLLH
jgi:hypothetical protein